MVPSLTPKTCSYLELCCTALMAPPPQCRVYCCRSCSRDCPISSALRSRSSSWVTTRPRPVRSPRKVRSLCRTIRTRTTTARRGRATRVRPWGLRVPTPPTASPKGGARRPPPDLPGNTTSRITQACLSLTGSKRVEGTAKRWRERNTRVSNTGMRDDLNP